LKKWLIGLGIAAILAAAFFWGGNSPQPGGDKTAAGVVEQPRESAGEVGEGAERPGAATDDATESDKPPAEGPPGTPASPVGEAPSEADGAATGNGENAGASGQSGVGSQPGAGGQSGVGGEQAGAGGQAGSGAGGHPGTGANSEDGSSEASPSPRPAGSGQPPAKPSASGKPGATQTAKPGKPAATPAPTKDEYGTEPVPSGKPDPVEWQDADIDKTKAYTATLSVSAATILDNLELFDEDKLEVLPEDGVIYSARKVTFYEGESVFDVLLREMKKSKIHMEFEMTPIYNSHYIEGINNIYEFDCGELSGWMYKVDGWFPNYGSSRYQLEDGDVIEWVYTCDLGRDVGDDSAAGRKAS
jgi:hypothetical protein